MSDAAKQLEIAAEEIARAGYCGWGNACSDGAAELREARKEIERLRAVLDAARPICLRWETRGLGPNLPGEKPTDAELLDMLCEKVRALDGTNPTHLSTSVEVFVQPCPTCGREAHDAG